jgi:hypothetical protein
VGTGSEHDDPDRRLTENAGSRREVVNAIENAVEIDADKLQELVFRAVFAARP